MLSALEEELAALQEAALIAVNDVNDGGLLLEDRLWVMLAHVRTVALHGLRHAAALALATAQLCSGHDLRLLEPGFLVGIDEEEQEDLIGDFTATTRPLWRPCMRKTLSSLPSLSRRLYLGSFQS